MTYAKMRNKKGVSPVIAWVLILGMTISIGAIVTNWYLGKSKQMTEETLTTLEGGIECNEVNINVAYTKDASGQCVIKVANTGKFKIDMIRINSYQKEYGKNPKEYLNYSSTRDTDVQTLCGSSNPITVLAELKKDTKITVCENDRQYTQKQL